MTIQEYVSDQFVGKDKHRLSVQNDLWKSIKESYQEKLGYVPFKPMALITAHNKETPSVIESIGFSDPNDIINDNFGVLFSGILSSVNTHKTMTDYLGVVRTYSMLAVSGWNRRENSPYVSSCGSYMRVGRGGGGVQRSDTDLFDPFIVAPEANFFVTGSGGWVSANQQVVIDGVLTNVTTSDSIGECGLYMLMKTTTNSTAGSNKINMMSHDVAGTGFVGGQNINVTYTWSIT
jgi:hypothetical protein